MKETFKRGSLPEGEIKEPDAPQGPHTALARTMATLNSQPTVGPHFDSENRIPMGIRAEMEGRVAEKELAAPEGGLEGN